MVTGHGGLTYIQFGIYVLVILMVYGNVDAQLAGSFASCKNEGDTVYVPGVSDNPCITCTCVNRIIKCQQTKCPSTEGCYVILFDNFRQERKCCDVCKGCDYNGRSYESGASWVDTEDPCTAYKCQASVVTKSKTICYTPCSNPIQVPGQCCPSCAGCTFNSQSYQNGERFTLSSDPCTQCTCQEGTISCSLIACPVLNCPLEAVYKKPGDCCPKCTGQRKIFSLPGGRCFHRKKIYSNGRLFRPDRCTKCECKKGTSICDREVCPTLNCAVDVQVPVKNSCCLTCPKKKQCLYNNKYYTHGLEWKPDTCTTCDCEDGIVHCQVEQCSNSLWCEPGYTLQFDDTECCPKCVESRAVCTVYGDPHYRTFDGRMYNFQGACKYILTEEKFEDSFSIRVRNDARTSSSFTWTKMLVIFIRDVRINLQQRLRVKVNRKRVRLPYTHNNIPSFTIKQTGHHVVLNWSSDLTVTWDGDSYVEVSVSSRYKRKLRGLCGNFNGLSSDDLKGSDGRTYQTGAEFGETWRYGSRSACVIKPELTSESPCENNTETYRRAKKECSFLLGSVFHRCRRIVDVRSFYTSCVTDTCECPSTKRCECESFNAYARACAQEGIHITWEPFAPCAAKCPIGAKFKECATPCPKTCANYDKIEPCLKNCSPGCQCKSGMVLHKNQCIKPNKCPTR